MKHVGYEYINHEYVAMYFSELHQLQPTREDNFGITEKGITQ